MARAGMSHALAVVYQGYPRRCIYHGEFICDRCTWLALQQFQLTHEKDRRRSSK
jgi:hypothetical protein